MEDWVSYFNQDQYGFSESFKKELATQLGEKFQQKLEYENLFKKYFYNLFLGMEDIEITQKENYVFGNASIVSPDSQNRYLTICWYSDFFEDKLEMHKQDVEGKITFLFCSDFPTEELKHYIKYKKPKEQAVSKHRFITQLNFNNFPDLTITFEGKEKLTTTEQNEIITVFKRNTNLYVSEFNKNSIVVDFQIDTQNYKENNLEKGKEFITESLSLIQKLSFGSKINHVSIE